MMPALSKSCPKCCTNVHARRCVCDCGHSFAKPKISFSAARKSNQIAMKCKRTLETAVETMYRKDRNRANMAKKRALESQIETMFRRRQDSMQDLRSISSNLSQLTYPQQY